jgi:glycosyltransferase involved in cell wall biosynthesis
MNHIVESSHSHELKRISPYPLSQHGFVPFFSVVMCTYNRANYLERAIDSLIAQTEKDWELIVVDDGSTDETYQIVRKYAETHQNIKYIFHSHRGLPSSRNAGIIASAGMFITFLDSDDEYESQHLAIRKQVCIENPEIPFFHGGVEIIGNEFVPDKDNPSILIHLSECVVGGTFVIRKDILVGLGGYPHVSYGDDSALYANAVSSKIPIAKLSEPTYRYYRDTPDSLCNTIGAS